MNYLAHFHLSHGHDDLLVGALLGDFVKGPLSGQRNKSLEQGILLHRKIDAFTDSHPLVRQAHQLFSPGYRRFAGIMTDVVFDHFLNRHWNDFHPQSLQQFSDQIFQLLSSNDHLTPPAKNMANVLEKYRLFEAYQHWQTVETALERIGQRIQRENPLDSAASELELHYSEMEATFLNFYPKLQQHANETRAGFLLNN
ncbi:MAG: ACP phosphodiesterase [Oceanicoccus sp.]